VLSWADNLLATNPTRRGIILSHFISNTGNQGGFGPQGQAIYDALKNRPNLDVMLCGHVPGEGRRQDTFNGNTVHTMLSDYQGRTAGGNGWLRILEFSPANNEIRVKTYSPWLNQYENDADSEFSLPYDMNAAPQFQVIGTASNVPSGSTASFGWTGRATNTAYEWYATVSDGSATSTSPVWNFTTASLVTYTLSYAAGPNGSISGTTLQTVNAGASGTTVTAVASPGYHFVDWSDGVLTASRTDTNVMMNLSVAANFAPDASPNTVNVGAPAGTITLGNPVRTVPVTISRTTATPLMAFSVVFSVSSSLSVSGGTGGIHQGTYLSSANPATSFNIVDLGVDGGGTHSYQADGTTLGLPCGSSAPTGTLFTIDVAGAAASGSGTVTVTSLTFRDCTNADLASAIGTPSIISIDRSAPAVTVTLPNGGETWPIGSSRTIAWTGNDLEGIAS
jgi:hypothetical protein